MNSTKEMIANYNKPTPKRWRRIGDYTMLVTMFLQANVPALPISATVKVYVLIVLGFVGMSIKFWTNTKKTTDGTKDSGDTSESKEASKP